MFLKFFEEKLWLQLINLYSVHFLIHYFSIINRIFSEFLSQLKMMEAPGNRLFFLFISTLSLYGYFWWKIILNKYYQFIKIFCMHFFLLCYISKRYFPNNIFLLTGNVQFKCNLMHLIYRVTLKVVHIFEPVVELHNRQRFSQ
jgi:hypothetical protein